MDEADGLLGAAAADRALERGAEIVVLGLEEIEPPLQALTLEVRRGFLRERDVGGEMAVLDGLAFIARGEPLGREIADRHEHPEARLAAHLGLAHEALVDELAQAIEHGAADVAGRTAHGLELPAPRPGHEGRTP